MSRSLSEREREKLTGEIAALQSLNVEQLKARWRTLYQTEAPIRFSRDLLMRAVAYRLQERALGGLKPATRRLLQRVAAAAHARRPLKLKPLRTLSVRSDHTLGLLGGLRLQRWLGLVTVALLEAGAAAGVPALLE